MKNFLVLIVTVVGGWAAGSDIPFEVQMGSSFQNDESVIYQGDGFTIRRRVDAQDAQFDDLFWINTSDLAGWQNQDFFNGVSVMYRTDKFVIARLSENELMDLAALQHEASGACGGIFRLFGDTLPVKGAAAFQPMVDSSKKISKVVSSLEKVSEANLTEVVEEMAGMTTRDSRLSSRNEVTDFLLRRYESLVPDVRKDVVIQAYDHGKKTKQNSIIIKIKGAKYPDESVILGSHIDSINVWRGRAPGADDNASGTATNLEIFRIIMEEYLVFERTIEIHGYAAEELGLVGSQSIAKAYRQAQKKVVSMLQVDMNLFRSGDVDAIWLISNGTDVDLNRDLVQFGKAYMALPIKSGVLTSGSSDHAAWSRQGYAVAFPFENPRRMNRKIHTSQDTIANSGAFSQAALFVKLGLAYLGHYGGLR